MLFIFINGYFMERKEPITSRRVKEIAGNIRESNDIHRASTEEIESIMEKYGVCRLGAQRLREIASGIVVRERIESLLEQLHTGNLEGITPVASLSAGKEGRF